MAPARNPFSFEEDQDLLRFLYNELRANNPNAKMPKGNQLWHDYLEKNPCITRTAKGISTRFRKHIYDNMWDFNIEPYRLLYILKELEIVLCSRETKLLEEKYDYTLVLYPEGTIEKYVLKANCHSHPSTLTVDDDVQVVSVVLNSEKPNLAERKRRSSLPDPGFAMDDALESCRPSSVYTPIKREITPRKHDQIQRNLAKLDSPASRHRASTSRNVVYQQGDNNTNQKRSSSKRNRREMQQVESDDESFLVLDRSVDYDIPLTEDADDLPRIPLSKRPDPNDLFCSPPPKKTACRNILRSNLILDDEGVVCSQRIALKQVPVDSSRKEVVNEDIDILDESNQFMPASPDTQPILQKPRRPSAILDNARSAIPPANNAVPGSVSSSPSSLRSTQPPNCLDQNIIYVSTQASDETFHSVNETMGVQELPNHENRPSDVGEGSSVSVVVPEPEVAPVSAVSVGCQTDLVTHGPKQSSNKTTSQIAECPTSNQPSVLVSSRSPTKTFPRRCVQPAPLKRFTLLSQITKQEGATHIQVDIEPWKPQQLEQEHEKEWHTDFPFTNRKVELAKMRKEITVYEGTPKWPDMLQVMKEAEYQALILSESVNEYKQEIDAIVNELKKMYAKITAMDEEFVSRPLPPETILRGSKLTMKLQPPRIERSWHSEQHSGMRKSSLTQCLAVMRDIPPAVLHYVLPNVINLEADAYGAVEDEKSYIDKMDDLINSFSEMGKEYVD